MITKFLGYFNLKKMALKDILSGYFKLFFVRIYLFFTLISNFILWLLCWLLLVNIDQNLAILHYNVIFGIDYIGSPQKILFLPAIGLVITVINMILSLWLAKKEKLLAQILLLSALIFQIFLGLSLYSIHLINFVNIKF